MFVLPTLATSQPGYVNDVLIVATGGTPAGDVGGIQTLIQVGGIAFLLGGFLFGIALFRAGVLARWAAALLSVGAVATVLPSCSPQVNFRLFAIPIGVAMIGLGYSLWREQRTQPSPRPAPVSSPLDPAGAQVTASAAQRIRPPVDQADRVGAVRADRPGRDPRHRRLASPGRAGRRSAVHAGDPRFTASPVPLVVHIVCAVAYAVLGAFQFSAALRRRRPGWHRRAGRVLVVLGLAVALSALWMTLFYARHPGTGELAYLFRLAFGSGMAASIVLGFAAIRRGDVPRHRAWMTRAYALALGAGTQVFTQGIGPAVFGPSELIHDLSSGRRLGHQPRRRRVHHPPAASPGHRKAARDGPHTATIPSSTGFGSTGTSTSTGPPGSAASP